MSNIKDDIKIVAKFNKENRFRDCGKLNNAIDNLINSYEEHKKENEELRNKVKELERVIDRGWLVYTEKLENQIADLKSLNREKILELKQNSIPKQKVKDILNEIQEEYDKVQEQFDCIWNKKSKDNYDRYKLQELSAMQQELGFILGKFEKLLEEGE